jgi:hypothetical protein
MCARSPGEHTYKREIPSLDWVHILSRAADCVLQVKSFGLRFGNRDFWGERIEANSLILTPGLQSHRLLMIRTLRLEGFAAAANDLVDSILGLSTTLMSPTIVDARLLKEAGQPRAC